MIDSAVARRIAHDLRGATGIVAGALNEIEAGSDPAAFVSMARRSTARLERTARTLDALGHPEGGVVDVDVDATIASALENVLRELRPGFSVEHQRMQPRGTPTVTVDKACFFAAVEEVLAFFGKRSKGIRVDGGVLVGVGFDHIPAMEKPFEDPLGAARLLFERAGTSLSLVLDGNLLRATITEVPSR